MTKKEYDRQRYLNKRDKILAHCKENYIKNKEQRRIYLTINKLKINLYQKVYRANHAEQRKEYYANNIDKLKIRDRGYLLKNKYNITPHQYQYLLEKHNFKCAICGVTQSDIKRPLSVDHNHDNKKIRGLLCDNCNPMLGFAKDKIKTFERAIKYLKKHEGDKK